MLPFLHKAPEAIAVENKDLIKQVKPGSWVFLAMLALVGLLLTIVGALLGTEQHLFWMNVFSALGAAIIGTAVSLLMARVFEPSQMDEIYRLLSSAQNSPLITDDNKVRPRRLTYHGYLYSHALGKPQWKYRIFNFEKDRRPGYLHAKVDVWVPPLNVGSNKFHNQTNGNAQGSHQVYWYNGYLCEPYHLLLVGHLDPEMGSEPDVIQIFPFALKTQGDVMAGLTFLETSDNKHIVTPTLLSKNRLSTETDFGPVMNDEEQANLMRIWQEQFLGDCKINIPTA